MNGVKKEKKRLNGEDGPAMRSCKRLFFSSPLTGAWKNVLSTECIRFASPGARVGHACEKVRAMKGIPPYNAAASSERGSTEEGRSGNRDGEDVTVSGGRGMAMGRLGFSVAEVGRGGRESTVDVSPGTRRTTSFWMFCGFCETVRVKGGERWVTAHLYSNPTWWRGVSHDMKDEVADILRTMVGKRGEADEETVR